jgi:phosphatidylserine synthase
LLAAGGVRARGFAPWALGVWVLLLLAMFGAIQYLRRGDFVYLAAAVGILVVCAGCILRQGWARPTMRALCVALVLWTLVSGGLMLSQWERFEVARQHALAQPQLVDLALWLIARAQRTWQVALGLKALAIPLLLWLTWELGRPAVQTQFKRRG